MADIMTVWKNKEVEVDQYVKYMIFKNDIEFILFHHFLCSLSPFSVRNLNISYDK